MNAYEFRYIPELTEEEKQSPYARFYNEPILPPKPAVLAAVQPGNAMDPDMALDPKDIGDLFRPNPLKVDNGYCVLPDGTGFSVIHTSGPSITADMEQWWMPWATSSEYNYLNYKIWMPSLHFTHAQPIWEDLGWGPSKIHTIKRITSDTSSLPL